MEKVVTAKEMRRVEQLSFREGVSDQELMEEAGSQVASSIAKVYEENGLEGPTLLLAGRGNNGGDAYVAGLYLIERGYEVIALNLYEEELSPLCKASKDRFLAADGQLISISDLSSNLEYVSLILDGLFGTGFHGEVTGIEREVIEAVNLSSCPTIAIDIPSGVNGETGAVESVAIEAFLTLTLCFPKCGLYLGDGWNHVGQIETLPIGLPENYCEMAEPTMELLTKEDVASLLPKVQRNRHKYERGSVIILAGSKEMAGAAYLVASGAFRGGAGMVHLLIKQGMEQAYHNIPELILIPYEGMSIEELATRINESKACVVGPGFGRSEKEQKLLRELLPKIEIPTVVDADALYLLANERATLPKQSLLTPHHGEMERLLGTKKPPFDLQFIEECQIYLKRENLSILLKGAPTLFLKKDQPPTIVPFGDPGMATAGCGDLLSGMLGAALSQGLPIDQAALFATSLHGLSGQIAAEKVTSHAMKSSDILEAIPEAYKLFN